jgi:hypothetical protein
MKNLKSNFIEAVKEVEEDYLKLYTDKYEGLAFYWHSEYKHILRNCTREERVLIHNKWVKAGLDLNGYSDEHQYYIDEVKMDLFLKTI